jgi:hypothetical protein
VAFVVHDAGRPSGVQQARSRCDHGVALVGSVFAKFKATVVGIRMMRHAASLCRAYDSTIKTRAVAAARRHE